GGGGLFSVPDDATAPTTQPTNATPLPADIKSDSQSSSSPAAAVVNPPKSGGIMAMDSSKAPAEFWNAYFAQHRADPATVRQTVRQLVAKKQFDQVIAMINAALRN